MTSNNQNSILIFSYIFFIIYAFYPMNSQAACPPAGTGIVAVGVSRTETGCTVTTAAALAYGSHAQASGTVNFSNGTITTSGLNAYGAYAQGASSLIHLVDIDIATGSADGLHADTGGRVTMDGGTITTTGASYGAGAIDNSIIDINGVTVQVSPLSVFGSIYGIYAETAGSTINVTNSHIVLAGDFSSNSAVAFAQGAGAIINLTGTSLVNNSAGRGVLATNAAVLDIHDSSITTNDNGVELNSATATLSETQIETSANSGRGIFASMSAINLDEVSVITHGTLSHGLMLANSQSIVNAAGIYTDGDNSAGIYLGSNNILTLTDTLVGTLGNSASAIVTVGSSNMLTATTTNFSADNADLIRVSSSNTVFSFSSVTAHAAPSQNFLRVDNFASVNMTAQNSVLSGDVVSPSGGATNLIFQGTTDFSGAINIANVTLEASSLWNLTANSTLSNLTQAGSINFVPNGNNFKTLTVNSNAIGQNGTTRLNTFLGGDNSPSDLLIIDGGAATGSTTLIVNNTTGAGALTSGNGILLVNAINGGTTTNTAFSLGNLVEAGPYEYNLFRGSIDMSGPDNWYLRSELISPSSVTTLSYRQEVSLYAAIPSMMLLYNRSLLDTLHQRVGEEPFPSRFRTSNVIQNFPKRLWLRGIRPSGRVDNGGLFHQGPDFHYHFLTLQGGGDIYRGEYQNGHRDHGGLYGALGNADGSVKHFTGITAGEVGLNVYTVGAYWTHFGRGGWYVDSVLQGNRTQNIKAKSGRIPTLITHANGGAASLEGGYPFYIRPSVTIEPQAQIVYQDFSLKNSHDIASHVNFDDTSSTAARLGVRLAKTGSHSELTAWVRANAWREFQGNSTTLLSAYTGFVPFASNLKGNWIQVDLGLAGPITPHLSLYGSINSNTYVSERHGHAYNGMIGLRFDA